MLIDDSPIESEYEWSGELGLPNDAVCTEKLALRCCFVGAAWDADADVAPAALRACRAMPHTVLSRHITQRPTGYESVRHSLPAYRVKTAQKSSTIPFLQVIAQRR